MSEFADGGVGVIASGGEVQQPGTLVRMGNPTVLEQKPQKETLPEGTFYNEMASDTFAIRTVQLLNTQVYMLLPLDPFRKRALIQCVPLASSGSLGAFLGTQQQLDSALSGLGATFNVAGKSLGAWILQSQKQVPVIIEYTSKQALYCCPMTTSDVGTSAVQAFVERFHSGTPIT